MATNETFVKRHSVLSYYVLVFAISWGGVLLIVGGPGSIPAPKEDAARLMPLVALAMVAGPSIASILLTGLVDGRAGFRELLARLLRWRVEARWYAVALLTAPLLMTALLLSLSVASPVFLPGILTTNDKASLLLTGLAAALTAGIFEELGWTGFVIPRLRLRHGVLATGLMMGALWGAWHYLVNFWGSGTSSGALDPAIFAPGLLDPVGVLLAYRVLIVWVYDRTRSLPIAMLMHASLTASTAFVLRPQATGLPLLAWLFALAAALWAVIAVVSLADRRHASQQQIRRRAA